MKKVASCPQPLGLSMGGIVCIASVGLNYHVVGDVIAGAMLGSITGAYATRVFRLRPTVEQYWDGDAMGGT